METIMIEIDFNKVAQAVQEKYPNASRQEILKFVRMNSVQSEIEKAIVVLITHNAHVVGG